MFKNPTAQKGNKQMSKTKVIAGVAFEISQPYAAGHTLTEAEAKALNQVRSENIGNNVREKVKELLAANDEAGAKALVSEKDSGYEFTLAQVSASAKLDPIEREARNIAKEIVKAKLAEKGLKITVVPEGYDKDTWAAKIDENIEKIAGQEAVLKEAKKAVDSKRKRLEALGEGVEV